jgi:hypothetical protein
MIIITTLPKHFAVELVGGGPFDGPMKIVERKLDNPNLYFGQFHYSTEKAFGIRFVDSPGCKVTEGQKINLRDLAVIPSIAQQEVARRFPKISGQYPTTMVVVGDERPASLTFTSGSGRVTVENVLLANVHEGVTRIRHVRFAIVIPKSALADDYESYLESLLGIGLGDALVGVSLLSPGTAQAIFKAA